MLVNTTHRVGAALAAAGALALVGLHVRACDARRDAGVPPVAASVVAAATAPASGEPAATADKASAIPSLTLPCIDDTTELLADGDRPLLCWGEHCLTDPGDLTSTVRRPPAAEPTYTVIEAGQVCTGKRCDRVGPRFSAAIAGMDDPTIDATRDHAAIVLATEGDEGSHHFEAWNRAADRKIDLGSPNDDDGEIEDVTAIGDVLVVTHACSSRWCNRISRIIDAHGRRRGEAAEPDAPSGREETTQAAIVALDAEHRVARGALNEVVMLDHGQVTATATVSTDWTVRLDDHTFAVLWCSGGDSEAACHLMQRRVEVEEQERGSPSVEITTVEDHRVPRCPQD